MGFSSRKLWLTSKDYFMIVLGITIYAFGFSAFILPEKVVIGGAAGLSSLVYFIFGVPVGITNYAINITLLAIAYRIVGRTFIVRTVFGATVISLAIGLFQPLFPEPLIAGQPFMNVLIGGMCCGVGIGLAFVHNGSTGGTDIVAAMVSKRSNVTVGRMMMYIDFVIISSSYFIFHEIDKIVFGFVVLFLGAWVADQVINTTRQACQFTIFSRKWQEIATAINNEAHRGCTVLSGMGWYSKQDVKVLLVMCRKIESVTVFRIIKSIDKNAFVTQANVNGVYGEGFDEYKMKMKSVSQPQTSHREDSPKTTMSPAGSSNPSGHPQSLT